ncbi:hypothetical protein [Streptomyces althioticus]|uniref:hypothetical protein n=1 Tax=Streptomyces althioticus TaxID=83380 RepID=UPI0033CE56C6
MGELLGPTWVIELGIGEHDPVESVMLHVRGCEDDALPVIFHISRALGCRPFGCSNGELLDPRGGDDAQRAASQRADEAIAVVEAHPDPWNDPCIVRAGLLSTAGHLAAAAAGLRDLGTIEAREELFEVLVRQGRAAEAIVTHPTPTRLRSWPACSPTGWT